MYYFPQEGIYKIADQQVCEKVMDSAHHSHLPYTLGVMYDEERNKERKKRKEMNKLEIFVFDFLNV